MSRRIAFFDFDGTITTKDTLLEFLKFSFGKPAFYKGFALNLHYLIGYKLKVISNQKAKEKVLSYFLSDVSIERFQQLCERFATEEVPKLIRSKAKSEIEKLAALDVELVIVSASPGNWIAPWASLYGFTVIATRLTTTGNKLTGSIDGANCYGAEKVRRITELFTLSDYETIYAYGDSGGDIPMLQLANQGFMKPFH